jgi:hypothetical protein
MRNAPSPVKKAVIDLSVDGPRVISATPCLLVSIQVLVALSAHAVNVKDGSTTFWIIPASSAVTYEKRFYNAEVSNLILDNNVSATGTLVVYYIPLT